MRRLGVGGIKLTVIVLLGFTFWLSDDVGFMARGSDSATVLFAPPVAVQAIALACFAACLLAPSRRRGRISLLMLAGLAAALGSHRLLVDNVRNEIADVYFLSSVQTLSADPAREFFLSYRPLFAGFRVGQAGSDRSIWIFSPPWIGLNQAAVAHLAERG